MDLIIILIFFKSIRKISVSYHVIYCGVSKFVNC